MFIVLQFIYPLHIFVGNEFLLLVGERRVHQEVVEVGGLFVGIVLGIEDVVGSHQFHHRAQVDVAHDATGRKVDVTLVVVGGRHIHGLLHLRVDNTLIYNAIIPIQ